MSFMTSHATVEAHSMKRRPKWLTLRRLSVLMPIAQGGIMISTGRTLSDGRLGLNRNAASLDMPRIGRRRSVLSQAAPRRWRYRARGGPMAQRR
jgi:hypothetical protein